MVTKTPKRPHSTDAKAIASLPPPGLLSSPEHVLDYYRKVGLPIDSSVDIERIITSNPELQLVRKDLGINDAYIKRIDTNKYEIAVNLQHHPNRQRFSMAHEYAHYLLHRDKIDLMQQGEQILHRNEERNPIEYQANQFAAELLIPRALLETTMANSGTNLKTVASILRVSQDALRYRLLDMGYRVA